MEGIIIKRNWKLYSKKCYKITLNSGEIVDTSDEWILTRTGIKERKISIDENTCDLAIKACKIAIKNAKLYLV